MKTLIFILFTLFSITNSTCIKKFELIKATSQEWHGGREQTGFGTYYELTILPKTNSDNLVFDQMWIGKKYFDVQCFQKGKKMRNNLFSKGDTITIRVNLSVKPKPMPFDKKDDNKTEHYVPKKYEGDALLSYLYKGKRKYFEIKKFTKIEPIFYP